MGALTLAATSVSVGRSALWGLRDPCRAMLAGASGRYHSYSDAGTYGFASQSQSSSGGVLLPPLAWLYQDWEAALQACPVLLGICGAAVAGFVLQHCGGRCFPFQRLAVFYPPTLKAGEVWRLLSHAMLHSDLAHLAVNLLHILNSLDLEGVVAGVGYPSCYTLGSVHTARAAAVAASFAALVASVPYFGAMFEGASALCFGLDGALLGACGLLLGGGREPSLRSFLEVRLWYTLVHMGIDLLRGCSSPGGTVGTSAHFAGFVGGLCYVLAVLPPLGGRPVPTIRCLARGAGGRWEEANCLAFFSPHYSWPVEQVQMAAQAVLALGVAFALVNAFVFRRGVHASADGYSVLVKVPGGQRLGGRGDDHHQLEAAIASSLEEERLRLQRQGGGGGGRP